MKKTTCLAVVLEILEDDFPTRVPPPAPTETTAEELTSSTRIRRLPTPALPPALQRLAKWVAR